MSKSEKLRGILEEKALLEDLEHVYGDWLNDPELEFNLLTEKESERFINALENPPKPNEKLKSLFELEQHASGAKKHQVDKLHVELITPEMEEGLAEVLTYGMKKYAARNWEKGLEHSVHYAAAKRHMMKFWQGIDLDDESGLHHIAHAMCNLGMLYTNIKRNRFDLDDRYVGDTFSNINKKDEITEITDEEIRRGFVTDGNVEK